MKNILALFILMAIISSCTKDSTSNDNTNNNASPTVKDQDGNTYETVVICGKTWLKTNLKVKHYRNGDPITYFSDESKQ